MKKIAWVLAVMAWLQIVAAPLIIGLIISFIIYTSYPTRQGFLVCILVSALGLLVGIIAATRIWKKRGTVDFISGVSASLEYDKLDKEKQ